MRGKHCELFAESRQSLGSPPHARETRSAIRDCVADQRITPACAGNTVPVSFPCFTCMDHPRMRGKHFTMTMGALIGRGSPPHARETRTTCVRRSSRKGITPACAGNTLLPSACRYRCRDHPRMRGKHPRPELRHCPMPGSPPHARETPGTVQEHRVSARITPACAGNTLLTWYPTSFNQDHPRMRGKHHQSAACSVSILGSPPHARETRLLPPNTQ